MIKKLTLSLVVLALATCSNIESMIMRSQTQVRTDEMVDIIKGVYYEDIFGEYFSDASDDEDIKKYFFDENEAVETIKNLIKDRVHINTKCDKDENTPLMLAILHKRPKIAQLLIENDAKLDAKNKKGKTALDLASESGQTKIVDLIKNKQNNKINDVIVTEDNEFLINNILRGDGDEFLINSLFSDNKIEEITLTQTSPINTRAIFKVIPKEITVTNEDALLLAEFSENNQKMIVRENLVSEMPDPIKKHHKMKTFLKKLPEYSKTRKEGQISIDLANLVLNIQKELMQKKSNKKN